MHDSLPLQLFSTATLAVIFRDDLRAEFSMAPWCLLAATLTLPEITARTRVELLETDLGFCFFIGGSSLRWVILVELSRKSPKGLR
jgi:hypothetical protein